MSIISNIKNLTRHSAIYAISTGIQKLPGLILMPIYTNPAYLPSRSEYGDYALVFAFIAFMYFFYTYGMDAALMRYFFLGKWERKTVFSTTFLVLLITSPLTSLLIFIFSEPLAEWILLDAAYAHFMKLAAGILLLDTVCNLCYLLLRAEEKSIQFTSFKVVRFLLELGFNIYYLVYLRTGVVGILYASASVAAVNLLLMAPIIIRNLRPAIDRQLLREMLRFGVPFLPHGIAFTVIELVDRIIITQCLGKDAAGLYSANYKFSAMLSVIINAFRNAWQPFFLRVANQENAKDIYSQVFTYYQMLAGTITLLGLFFIHDILTFDWYENSYILGQEYWEAIYIVPIILLAYCFYGSYIILTPGFYIEKKSKFMIVFSGTAAVVNIVGNILLIPVLNIWGAAIATLLSYIVMAALIYFVSGQVYPISVEWRRILTFYTLAIAAALAYFAFMPGILVKILIVFLFMITAVKFVLTKSERQAISLRLHGLIKRRS